MSDVLGTVRRQVDAFNAHNLEAFLETYAEDATVTGSTDTPLVGRAAMRAHYAPRLTDASLHCRLGTIVLFDERWVVAREAVTSGGDTMAVIAVFEVVNDVIARSMLMTTPGLRPEQEGR